MHESVINRDRYVEWVSDYVAARTDALSRRAQLVLDRRLVERALTRAHAPISNGGPLDQVLPLFRRRSSNGLRASRKAWSSSRRRRG